MVTPRSGIQFKYMLEVLLHIILPVESKYFHCQISVGMVAHQFPYMCMWQWKVLACERYHVFALIARIARWTDLAQRQLYLKLWSNKFIKNNLFYVQYTWLVNGKGSCTVCRELFVTANALGFNVIISKILKAVVIHCQIESFSSLAFVNIHWSTGHTLHKSTYDLLHAYSITNYIWQWI